MTDDPTIVAAARRWNSDRTPRRVERDGVVIVSYCRTRVYLDRDAWEMLPADGVLLMRVEPKDGERFVLALTADELEKVFGAVRSTASWRDSRCYHFTNEPPAAKAFRVELDGGRDRSVPSRSVVPASADGVPRPVESRSVPRHLTSSDSMTSQSVSDNADGARLQTVDLQRLPISELLRLNRSTLRELRSRGVVRSSNAPTGDYAEWLVARLTGGELAAPSQKSWDVTTPDRRRVQVKARALTPENGSRQLSPIRSWDFNELAVVLFDDSFQVIRVSFIERDLARQSGVWREYVRGWILFARDELLVQGIDRTDDARRLAR